jgi:hypothetical protein
VQDIAFGHTDAVTNWYIRLHPLRDPVLDEPGEFGEEYGNGKAVEFLNDDEKDDRNSVE